MKTAIKKTIATILSLTAVTLTNIAPVATPIPIMEEVTLTASAEMVGSDVHQILFDYIYYADKYADLKKAFGYNKAALYNHWITYGKKEGRSPSSLYDPIYYRDKYGDLKRAYGNDYVSLYNHFVTYGIKEGRQASQYFSVEIYKNNYADLRNAFGTQSYNNVRYLQHWREYGLAERRNSTSKIPNNTPNNNNNNTTKTTTYYVTTQAGLILRASASTSSSKLCTMPYGSSIAVSSISNGWARCTYNGKSGYCSASYISTSKPNSNPTPSGYSKIVRNTGAYFRPKSNDSGWYGYHDVNGVSQGTPVYAVADGKVQFCQAYRVYSGQKYLTSYGNYIKFTSSDGKTTAIYAHLNSFNNVSLTIPSSRTKRVSGGTTTILATRNVHAGDLIGYVGTTGNSSGAHLHFEMRINGNRVDPTAYVGIPGR